MSRFRKLLAGLGVAASLLVLPTAALAQTSASTYTTGYRFDSLRRIAGIISPDPDGSGSIGFPAVRYTYDADDTVIKIEIGFLAAWQAETVAPANWANFTIKSVKTSTLDAMGNKTQELTTGGSGEKLALTQTAYDADDRPVCSVVRMNLATTATNACALGTVGSYGNDRVTTTHYDGDGHVDYTKRAVGSTNEQFYARYGYSANGNKIAETDANGNLTNYVYDGQDRLAYTYYPTLTTGAGTSNSADYESYGYDSNGNRTNYRRRNGQIYTYLYDAVNQQVLKTRSDNTGLNVASTYDLMGHLIRAQFANSSGTVSYSYDAIGRVLTTTDMFGQTLSYQYDQASLRTLMTFQDGPQQIYQYNAGNQLSWTGISGSTVGYGVGYDTFDRPATVTRANNANTAIGYDNADRVTSYGHSFGTASRNVTWAFGFNPAGGIVSVSTTNTDFDYREQQSATENHTFNGLNQDAAIAALATTCSAANAGYDCSGNLTNDSSRHFTYDIDNHLTALSGPASASYVYDPIGRLVQTTVNSTVTRFLYDGVNLVAEYDGLGAIQRRYMHTLGTDQPWVQFTGSAVGASNAKYLYADYHGSIIALADNTGAVANADIYKYGTYGEPLDINNNLSFSGSRFRYTGQTVLPEASLYYYKARVYDPVFGRFLQTDPIGAKDDLDLYAYTGNDPVNKVDPTGTQNDTNYWQLGWQWLTGSGPADQVFGQNDPATQQLRNNADFSRLRDAVATGQFPVGVEKKWDHSLGGLGGAFVYTSQYASLVTNGAGANLADTYLGSYQARFTVVSIKDGIATVNIHVWNESDLKSATHPPVLGYTPWWQKNVHPAIKAIEPKTGPLSPKRQDFYWTEQVKLKRSAQKDDADEPKSGCYATEDGIGTTCSK